MKTPIPGKSRGKKQAAKRPVGQTHRRCMHIQRRGAMKKMGNALLTHILVEGGTATTPIMQHGCKHCHCRTLLPARSGLLRELIRWPGCARLYAHTGGHVKLGVRRYPRGNHYDTLEASRDRN
ncbi:MAG: hypothetical protein M3176_07945, partial [Chloroflexota bacterium]|nr:hypothetical protein [Chloroflexota bacterium]